MAPEAGAATATAGQVEDASAAPLAVQLPEKYLRESPYDVSPWYSQITFGFMWPLLSVGSKRPLTNGDLPPLAEMDLARTSTEKHWDAWNEQREVPRKAGRRLLRALWTVHKADFFVSGVFALLFNAMAVTSPALLGPFIDWLSDDDAPDATGYYFAAALTGAALFSALCVHTNLFMMYRMGWRSRIGLTGALHRKMLTVSAGSLRSHAEKMEKIKSKKMEKIMKKKAAGDGGKGGPGSKGAKGGKGGKGKAAGKNPATASIYNLIASDADRVDMTMRFLHSWITIPSIIILIALLMARVGFAAGFAAVGTLLSLLQFIKHLGKKMGRRRKKTAMATDQRVHQMSEVLQSMPTVKIYAWEAPFTEKIVELRRAEHKSIKLSQRMKAINMVLATSVTSFTALVTFAVYINGEERDMSIADAFSVIALINVLRNSTQQLSMILEQLPEAFVALKRMEGFLDLPEVHSLAAPKIPADQVRDGEELVHVDGASFYWPSKEEKGGDAAPPVPAPAAGGVEEKKGDEAASGDGDEAGPAAKQPLIAADKGPVLALDAVRVSAHRGQLTLVNGPVGAGKSALLSALLGELESVNPERVHSRGALAYSPQEPWIMSGSLKSNILFNADYDEERFEKVMHACALDVDAEQLPNGVDTEIGEKGVNLSGGQKARVSLARACYAVVDVVLLDDPLAAVDPEVAAHLFRACIQDYLLGECNVAVVLVTHQQQFEPYAHTVLKLGLGGRTESLVTQTPEPRPQSPPPTPRLARAHSTGFARKESEDDKEKKEKKAPVALMQQEDRATGQLTWRTWTGYFAAGGYDRWIFVAIMLSFAQAVQMFADFYLKIWAEADDQQNPLLVGIYSVLCFSVVFVSLVRSFSFYSTSLRASSFLHNAALASVLRAPLYFFAMTPLGRILNRFSSDIGQIDEFLSSVLFVTLYIAHNTLGTLVLACVVVPWICILMPFVVYILWILRQFTSRSIRELKRMDMINRSPVYSSFSSAINGLVAIRAYGRAEQVDEHFQEKLGLGAIAYYYWIVANRWVGFRLDLVAAAMVASLTFSLAGLKGSIDPGLAGFGLVYIITLTAAFQFMVRMSMEVETFMTSVERVIHYATEVPQEAVEVPNPNGKRSGVTLRAPATEATAVEARAPQKQGIDAEAGIDPSEVALLEVGDRWPTAGALKIDSLRVRYRHDLPTVLKGINIDIPAGIKVGICGRTGSGKSSLLLSLARLNEIEGGHVYIDNVDHQRVSLQELRRSLAVIPQEPHIFSGSIRFNMDPFHQYKDEEINDALRMVNLTGTVEHESQQQPLTLDSEIETGGANLSQGQRQLLSLARALLRRRKIVLLDEATAAVDFKTDSVIQRTLREADGFHDATCVIIAHRIKTIIDADLIVVLDDGNVAEVGSPTELINQGGVFAGMVRESELQHGGHVLRRLETI